MKLMFQADKIFWLPRGEHVSPTRSKSLFVSSKLPPMTVSTSDAWRKLSADTIMVNLG